MDLPESVVVTRGDGEEIRGNCRSVGVGGDQLDLLARDQPDFSAFERGIKLDLGHFQQHQSGDLAAPDVHADDLEGGRGITASRAAVKVESEPLVRISNTLVPYSFEPEAAGAGSFGLAEPDADDEGVGEGQGEELQVLAVVEDEFKGAGGRKVVAQKEGAVAGDRSDAGAPDGGVEGARPAVDEHTAKTQPLLLVGFAAEEVEAVPGESQVGSKRPAEVDGVYQFWLQVVSGHVVKRAQCNH